MPVQGGSITGNAAAQEGVAALRARLWLVVLLVVAGLAAGYLLAPKGGGVSYRVWVISQPLSSNRSVTETGISTPEGPLAADFVDGGVLGRIEHASGLSHDYLVDHLKLAQPPNGGPNPPIKLTAEAGDEDKSRVLLRQWMAAIHAARIGRVARALDRGEKGLRKDLRKADRRDEPATRVAIVDLLARMQALRTSLTLDYRIWQKPRAETVSASRSRSTLIGGLSGLIAGVVLALVVALLGGRLRTRDGLDAAFGIEVLADLRSADGIPSAGHAKARLSAQGGGSPPASLAIVPCGSVEMQDALARVSAGLGDDTQLNPTAQLGGRDFLAEVGNSAAWAIVASPRTARRADVAALHAELDGIGSEPAGLFIV